MMLRELVPADLRRRCWYGGSVACNEPAQGPLWLCTDHEYLAKHPDHPARARLLA